MPRHAPSTTAITIDADRLNDTIATDGFPFHIRSEGKTDSRLPWQVQAYHPDWSSKEASALAKSRVTLARVLAKEPDHGNEPV